MIPTIPFLQRIFRRFFDSSLDTWLLFSADNWHPFRVKIALWLGADPQSQYLIGVSPLISRVSRMGSDQVLKVLLDFGVDPNYSDGVSGELSWRPIHHAALKGRASTIRILFNYGADIHCQENNGWDPVFIAARENKPDAIITLAELGASTEKTINGEPPLLLCARRGFDEALDALLVAGANPNALSHDLKTAAIHLAAAAGFESICRRLFEAGANPSALSYFDRTPSRIAYGEGHCELGAMLEKWSLDIECKSTDNKSLSSKKRSL